MFMFICHFLKCCVLIFKDTQWETTLEREFIYAKSISAQIFKIREQKSVFLGDTNDLN